MESRAIGRWGRLHQEYLIDAEPKRYKCILSSDSLWEYLDAIDERAQREYDERVNEIKSQMGIEETDLYGNRADWQMELVRMLAEECVLQDIIYK